MEKQRAILESVIKEEIDFISYVDLADGMVHTIVTNEDADVMPPIDGDYQKVNDMAIPEYVHPEDRERCGREFRLCLLYTSPSPRDQRGARMPSSA